ncbi:MAG: hypothetical protein OHK0019_00560 [Saprospiraceae bacterium]
MKKIPLTQGLFAIVDDEDYEELMKYKWSADKGNSTYYAQRTIIAQRKNVRMHRQIIGVTNPKLDVDHKNGNGLDNRRENLRVCTRSFNNANSKTPKDNKSGHKGVCWDKERKRWAVRIGRKHIGRYKDLRDAALAYNKAAIEIYGEFARINHL